MKTYTDIQYYGKNDTIESFCISVAFFRPTGSNNVFINGLPIEAGQTFTINQNVGDIDTSQYQIVFQGTLGTNELYVVRVVPTEEGSLRNG
jgi:hypothetical protein